MFRPWNLEAEAAFTSKIHGEETMARDDETVLGPMIRKLDRLSDLTEQDRLAIRALPFTLNALPAHQILVRAGDRVTRCCLLVSGFAARQKVTREGRRQIVSFHVPGDILDLQHMLLPRADHNVETITQARVAWIAHDDIRRLAEQHPRVGEALWRDTLIDGAVFREWVVNVGRRDARTRIAHMLCEFAARSVAAGVAMPARFDLPMSQDQIADATGLTPVHVNRTLRALEEEGVIARDRRSYRIADWGRMRAVADFVPDYLHAAAPAMA
jgi:CRP-like cAMP-binding protein